ncbi:hypothetical protein F4801DRAFT_132185 [Xylaria longipes]|nr:hypothetical protein F4801DRAFT_132185 [Xylaria longipes]
MADLARIARPWLLSLRPPTAASPYLGLGYSRGISTTPARRWNKRQAKPTTKNKIKGAGVEVVKDSILLPYTIVPPPLWRFPRSPSKFAQMVWLLAKNRTQSLGAILGAYFTSMGGFRWPRFKAGKAACIPAAKALHVQMSEAVAEGDKETLRRICHYDLFVKLAGAIDSRPPKTRAEWELVRYDNKLRYPRIADFRVAFLPTGKGGSLRKIKQATISISSVQRLTRYDKDGAVVPGSERERHMVEHFVMQSEIDEEYQSGPWKIWGTLPEMPFERIRDDAMIFADMGMRGRSR